MEQDFRFDVRFGSLVSRLPVSDLGWPLRLSPPLRQPSLFLTLHHTLQGIVIEGVTVTQEIPPPSP